MERLLSAHLNVFNEEPRVTEAMTGTQTQSCKVFLELGVECLAEPGTKSAYRGTSLIRNSAPLGPYSRNMPRYLWWS